MFLGYTNSTKTTPAPATTAEDKPPDLPKAGEEEKTPEPPAPSSSPPGVRKRPAGAVSLFGGIDIFGNKPSASPAEKQDDGSTVTAGQKEQEKEGGGETTKEREEKPKAKTVSLFDEDETDEADWNDSIFTSSKPAKNTLKVSIHCFWDDRVQLTVLLFVALTKSVYILKYQLFLRNIQ